LLVKVLALTEKKRRGPRSSSKSPLIEREASNIQGIMRESWKKDKKGEIETLVIGEKSRELRPFLFSTEERKKKTRGMGKPELIKGLRVRRRDVSWLQYTETGNPNEAGA